MTGFPELAALQGEVNRVEEAGVLATVLISLSVVAFCCCKLYTRFRYCILLYTREKLPWGSGFRFQNLGFVICLGFRVSIRQDTPKMSRPCSSCKGLLAQGATTCTPPPQNHFQSSTCDAFTRLYSQPQSTCTKGHANMF